MSLAKQRERVSGESAPTLDGPAPLKDHGRGLYDRDLYSWALEQSAALRAGRLENLDLGNLAEEIDDVGSEQFHKLTSAYRIVLLHLLKWDHQPERQSRSWAASIKTHRLDAESVLERNSGLKSRVAEALGHAYRRARIEAAAETGRDEEAFPAECPYGIDGIMAREVPWPSA